jgi:hypothetical protein
LPPKVREQFKAQGGHFLNQMEAEKVGEILLTAQRTLNPKIVGKSAEYIANLAGISVPSGTRCLLADCGGIGRDFPWSIEKLSPTLAFFVVDGVEAGAQKCLGNFAVRRNGTQPPECTRRAAKQRSLTARRCQPHVSSSIRRQRTEPSAFRRI